MCLLTTLCADRWRQTDDGLHRSMIWAWAPVFTLCRCNKWWWLYLCFPICVHEQKAHGQQSGCGWYTTGMLNEKCTICSTCEQCSAIRSIQRPVFRRFYHRHVEQKNAQFVVLVSHVQQFEACRDQFFVNSTNLLCLQHTRLPRCRDLAIFVPIEDDDDRQQNWLLYPLRMRVG